jgi:hypothetical protein
MSTSRLDDALAESGLAQNAFVVWNCVIVTFWTPGTNVTGRNAVVTTGTTGGKSAWTAVFQL